MDTQIVWFVIIALLLTVYSILDGFDFGVGIIHLFTENDENKNANVNAIGPFWDGNEVWLLTAGGSLFAAFPIAYAVTFSSLYLALTLLLVGLIFRAIAIEFRSKVESKTWASIWDLLFGIGSFIPPFILGVGLSNLMQGIAIDGEGIYRGTFLQLLSPFALIGGILTVSLFTLHGGLFLGLRGAASKNPVVDKAISISWILTVLSLVIFFVYALIAVPIVREGLGEIGGIACIILIVISLVMISVKSNAKSYKIGFAFSTLLIASLFALCAISLFPHLCISSLHSSFSIDIYSASATAKSHATMLAIAGLGLPFVILYTVYAYKIFMKDDIYSGDSYH